MEERDFKRVLVVGDLHGNVMAARRAFVTAKRVKADVIFQVGDFGFWPHADGGAFLLACSEYSEMVDIPLYWIDGNHENHEMLTAVVKVYGFAHPIEIYPGVHYVPRGCRMIWGRRTILGLGGAYSIDKEWRLKEDRDRRFMITNSGDYALGNHTALQQKILDTEHWSWWPGEEITDEQVMRIIREGGLVDVMFTHDKPISSHPDWDRKNLPECTPNQRRIQDVMNKIAPRLLIHGHLHYRYDREVRVGNNGAFCHVVGIDAEGRNNHAADHSRTRLPRDNDHSDMRNAMVLLDLDRLHVETVLDSP